MAIQLCSIMVTKWVSQNATDQSINIQAASCNSSPYKVFCTWSSQDHECKLIGAAVSIVDSTSRTTWQADTPFQPRQALVLTRQSWRISEQTGFLQYPSISCWVFGEVAYWWVSQVSELAPPHTGSLPAVLPSHEVCFGIPIRICLEEALNWFW